MLLPDFQLIVNIFFIKGLYFNMTHFVIEILHIVFGRVKNR